MRICPVHWKKLRGEIQAQGMWSFVPTSGEEAVQALGDGAFDPLMFANNIIMQGAINNGGPSVVCNNNDGSERCPICYGMSFNPDWEGVITEAVRHVSLYARKQGLLSVS